MACRWGGIGAHLPTACKRKGPLETCTAGCRSCMRGDRPSSTSWWSAAPGIVEAPHPQQRPGKPSIAFTTRTTRPPKPTTPGPRHPGPTCTHHTHQGGLQSISLKHECCVMSYFLPQTLSKLHSVSVKSRFDGTTDKARWRHCRFNLSFASQSTDKPFEVKNTRIMPRLFLIHKNGFSLPQNATTTEKIPPAMISMLRPLAAIGSHHGKNVPSVMSTSPLNPQRP